MGATSQYRPDTRAPGGGGMDYNGNPVGGGMGAQFNMGGPRLQGGAYGRPIYGGRPNPGDLYRPGGQPGFGPDLGNIIGQIGGIGGGMINQINPGLKPIGDAVGGVSRVGGDIVNRFMPGRGMIPPAGGRIGNPRQVNPGQGPLQPGMPAQPPAGGLYPMPSPVPGRGKGGGGGKGGMPGPGSPVIDDMRYKGPPGGLNFFDNNQNPDADAFNANRTLL